MTNPGPWFLRKLFSVYWDNEMGRFEYDVGDLELHFVQGDGFLRITVYLV